MQGAGEAHGALAVHQDQLQPRLVAVTPRRGPHPFVIGLVEVGIIIAVATDLVAHAIDREAVVLDAVGEAPDDRAIASAMAGPGIVVQAVEALHHIRHLATLARHPDGRDGAAVIGDLHLHAALVGQGEKIDTLLVDPAPGDAGDGGLGGRGGGQQQQGGEHVLHGVPPGVARTYRGCRSRAILSLRRCTRLGLFDRQGTPD